MFDKLKTRKGKLEHRVKTEMSKEYPKVDNILKAVDDYQKDNVNTIEKLKKNKKIEMNRINGALKQTINAHGPITKNLIGSAGKRIYGALIVNPNQEERSKVSVRDVLIGAVIGTIITLLVSLVL